MIKKSFSFFVLFLLGLLIVSCKPSVQQDQGKKTDIREFLGQWTMDIEGGWVGWIDVRQEENYLDADLLWKWGSVYPVSNIYLVRDQVLVVTTTWEEAVKKDETGTPLRKHMITSWLEVRKEGEKITGWQLSPRVDGTGVDSASFTGSKLPPMNEAPDLTKLKFGDPLALFNGKDLSGWKLIDDKQKNGFQVKDGLLVNDPVQLEGQPHISYGNLLTEQEFEDFNLKLEVNVPEGSNSGVYLRGLYEIQVMDTYGKELDSHHMGGVYSRIKPVVNAEKPAGEWQSMDITLCDRHVTVILNGVKIIDNQPVYGPTGGAIQSDVMAAGPIYLQGDHGKVSYRNIVLTPIVK
jgi:hypothetical protein